MQGAVSVGVLAIFAVCGALLVVYRGWLRRGLLTLEDPRPLGLLRIVFAAGLVMGALELALDARWFFSDEGMFLAEGARVQFAGSGLAGHDGAVFNNLTGVWHYLAAGTASTLHFWDSPAVVAVHGAALVLAAIGLMLGWRTRVCAWLCLGLMLTLLRRNNSMWGGDQVYLAVLFLVAASRCGAAYSVDNWARCRRLRRRGLLSEMGEAGGGAGAAASVEHPQGLAAIYRAVPAWPRVLIVFQLGVMYCANGLAKFGPSWDEGTAAAYALQSDPYTRFDTLPLLAGVGETALRWGTWAARGWECLFPAVVVGLVIAWARRRGMRRPRGADALWGALIVAVMGTLALAGGLSEETGGVIGAVRGIFGQTGGAIEWRPLLAWALVGAAAWAAQGDCAGREFVRRWVLGRRVWLGVGLVFHGVLQLLLNLGGFPLATVSLYIACFSGQEVARALGRGAAPMEDTSLPQRYSDTAELPVWVMVVVGVLVLISVVVVEAGATGAVIRWAVIVSLGLLLVVGRRTARAAAMDGSAVVWAYGPLGRLIMGALAIWQMVAIAASQIPERPSLARARVAGGQLVDRWLRVSGTAQKWAMFAPRPPQASTSLHVEVVDGAGRRHDLGRELHTREQLGDVQWWPDRRRKTLLNVMTSRRELVDWYARFVCREWALGHAGEAPRRVEVSMRVAAIPLPWAALPDGDRVERFVARAKVVDLRAVDCGREPHGQLPARVRVRHGIEAGPFVPVAAMDDRWERVRGRYGPGWPYDEWLALVVLGALGVRWRREDARRYLAAVAARRS